MYLIYLLPSTQQTIGYNWVYNDMFRLARVIVRLRSEPLDVFNDCRSLTMTRVSRNVSL
jgi:hypothetical protein